MGQNLSVKPMAWLSPKSDSGNRVKPRPKQGLYSAQKPTKYRDILKAFVDLTKTNGAAKP